MADALKGRDGSTPRAPRVLLIGLRGSGKSTVGPKLAAALGFDFVDLDVMTLARLGCATVEEAWRTCGVAAFREAECAALREAVGATKCVIASGGGTPTAPGATALIHERAAHGGLRVVYLRGVPETLRKRLCASDDPNRPSLMGRDPIDEIEDVFAARDALYQSLADVVIDVDQSVEDVVRQAAGWCEGRR